MGIIDTLKKDVDKLINPLEYETPIQREERRRKEDKKHELELAKVKNTRKIIRETRTHTDKDGSSSDGNFLNDWDKF